MKETDDDESDGNRNELITTMMRTKRTKTMMRMMGMMRMMRYDEDAEDENEDENEDGDYDEQSYCRVAKSIESSKRKPPNAVIVSRQVL